MQEGDTVYYYVENIVNGKFIPKLVKAEIVNKSASENRIVVKNRSYGFRVFTYSDIGTKLLSENHKKFI